ncbi:hypothetical protein GCM10010466_20840 [Planomonospora alba]|uniref:Uncharacterized protein n=1 Tax=Planomonospora alba TaxID=161354 RepID=A0ABP6N2R9_9ACTN
MAGAEGVADGEEDGAGSACFEAEEPGAVEEENAAPAASAAEEPGAAEESGVAGAACTAEGASTNVARASALTVAAVRTDVFPFPRGLLEYPIVEEEALFAHLSRSAGRHAG